MSAQLATAVSTNDEMEALSRRLCDEVAAWRFEYLPPDVVHTTKLFVLDTLGVIGGGARAPGIPEIGGPPARRRIEQAVPSSSPGYVPIGSGQPRKERGL